MSGILGFSPAAAGPLFADDFQATLTGETTNLSHELCHTQAQWPNRNARGNVITHIESKGVLVMVMMMMVMVVLMMVLVMVMMVSLIKRKACVLKAFRA